MERQHIKGWLHEVFLLDEVPAEYRHDFAERRCIQDQLFAETWIIQGHGGAGLSSDPPKRKKHKHEWKSLPRKAGNYSWNRERCECGAEKVREYASENIIYPDGTMRCYRFTPGMVGY